MLRGEIPRSARHDRQYHREGSSRRQRCQRGAAKQGIGISRGGRTTKIHAAVDGNGRPARLVITGGNVNDSTAGEAVLHTPRAPIVVAADKGYDSEKVRQAIRDDGGTPVIPSRANAKKKAWCPQAIYRRRHKVESFFCTIKDWRRVATRYDKLARTYLAAVSMDGALCWVRF